MEASYFASEARASGAEATGGAGCEPPSKSGVCGSSDAETDDLRHQNPTTQPSAQHVVHDSSLTSTPTAVAADAEQHDVHADASDAQAEEAGAPLEPSVAAGDAGAAVEAALKLAPANQQPVLLAERVATSTRTVNSKKQHANVKLRAERTTTADHSSSACARDPSVADLASPSKAVGDHRGKPTAVSISRQQYFQGQVFKTKKGRVLNAAQYCAFVDRIGAVQGHDQLVRNDDGSVADLPAVRDPHTKVLTLGELDAMRDRLCKPTLRPERPKPKQAMWLKQELTDAGWVPKLQPWKKCTAAQKTETMRSMYDRIKDSNAKKDAYLSAKYLQPLSKHGSPDNGVRAYYRRLLNFHLPPNFRQAANAAASHFQES